MEANGYIGVKMEQAINQIIKETIQATGKIIGTPLAIRLVSEEFEKMQSMNKEVHKIEVGANSIKVEIKRGTSEGRASELLMSIITTMDNAYSKVIGQVSKTMIKKSLDSAAKKYSKYKTLQEIARKY